ncbi:MAG: biopolymer transporter ExbD [Planctomycetaceae bacterium]|nr:biopolymer transporter ExbD [Planctomycetaceae bacterium]
MAGRALFSDATSKQRRIQSDVDLDITPMIDVTFLLLIFFIMTSTMTQESTLQVPPARHGKGVSTDTATVITVALRGDEPRIYLGDGVTGSPAALSEIPAYVQQQLSDSRKPRKTVIIKADRELPAGYIEEVARAANQVEGVSAFFIGVQDKQ